MMNAWCYVKSEYFSPCCLVRVVCCELSSCGVAKTIIIHVDETTVARVRHGTCDARGSWKRIPWSFASLGGFEPPEHVTQTSARAQTCTQCSHGPSVHRNRQREKRPAVGRARNADVRKKSISYMAYVSLKYLRSHQGENWRKLVYAELKTHGKDGQYFYCPISRPSR